MTTRSRIAFAAVCLALTMGDKPAAAQYIGPWRGAKPIAGGYGHSLGLKADGRIVAWGNNDYGQCNVPSPNEDFVAVAAGDYHSVGLKSDGRIVAWGWNSYYQTNVPAPNSNFIAVAAGVYHSVGLKSDGRVIIWGDNSYGQTTVPEPNSNFVAIAAYDRNSMGLKADGSVTAWGRNDNGQTNVPEPNADFTAIAAGGSHSLGLKTDGSIVPWGSNAYGQTNTPEPNADFAAIAAGISHTLGLKSDSSVLAWGHNTYAQIDVPEPNTNFMAAGAGWYHSLGLKSDGQIVAWGYNYYGQISVPGPNTDFGQQSGVVPPKGPTGGGTKVVILGANLGNGVDVTSVTLCGVSATIVTQDSRRIVVQTGPAPAPTSGNVVVYSTSYGSIIGTNAFSYYADSYTTNGTPLSWLEQHGLTNDTQDTDGDGLVAWKEYIAGTDPTNSASAFHLTDLKAQPASNGFVIRWSSASNRFYSIYSKSNLLEGSWSLIANNLPATPAENTYTDIVSQTEKLRLYRLGVTNAP